MNLPAGSSFKRKIAFALGDVFGGGSFNIINFMYPGFLAVVVGLSPYWISIIMIIARLWDAISDPIMGHISDRTKSKMGKRRIYILIGAPFSFVGLFLMFYPYSNPNVLVRVMCVLLSYILFCTIQTVIMIPYFSLSSEMTRDYQERAKFNTWRLGFSIFSSILCVAVPGIIIDNVAKISSRGNGYIAMSLAFGALFTICLLITAIFAKEEIISPPSTKKFNFKEMFEPLKLKPFREYLIMFLAVQVSMAVMSGMFFFFVDYYLMRDLTAKTGQSSWVGIVAAALMLGMQIVALPIYLKMIEKTSKTFVYRFGSIIWIVTALLVLFVSPEKDPLHPTLTIFIIAAVMGFGISAPGLIPHTIFGDVVDSGELKFGKRLEGSFSGIANFINKISQAIGLAMAMAFLGVMGFKENQPGVTKILPQVESAQLAIKYLIAFTPLVFMIIGIFASKRYRLDQKMHMKVRLAIENNVSIAEKEEIIKLIEG